MSNGDSRSLKKLAQIILLTAIFLALVALLTPWAANSLETVYATFPQNPSPRYQTFAALSGTIIAIAGVFVAVLTFWLTTRGNRRAQRKQHTITILLESRLSDTFQSINTLRKTHFPPGKDIEVDQFNEAYEASFVTEPSTHCKRSGAEALVSLLNYYEFLAAGVHERDLDEAMLRKTLRGIMCRLVDDARKVIHDDRTANPKTYEHLAWLYARWRNPNATDRNGKGNERAIGPT